MSGPEHGATTADGRSDRNQRLVLALDGFEGPIDLLLTLAREQKVDVSRLSILQLADQYLEFVAHARVLRLELAADYLVMAAWLAYLKSRLLLPVQENDEDAPSAAEMAEALAFQLRRLESMQDASVRLMGHPRLGRDVFARGAPDGMTVTTRTVYSVSLYELLSGYADTRRRARGVGNLTIERSRLFSVEAVIERFERLLGRLPDWQSIAAFLPPNIAGGIVQRSAVASTLGAALELAKAGRLHIRQDGTFGPIFIRSAEPGPPDG